MEIIMKVKCSANPGAGPSTHPSLKIVDHHRQLQQHTTNTPQQITTYIPPPPPTNSSTECPLTAASCAECTVGYCCNLPACCTPTTHQTLPTPPPLLPLQQEQYTSINVKQQIEDPPEFVSIDDEKVKQYLMKFGQQQLEQRQQEQKRVTRVFSVPSAERSRPVVYEIIELDDEGEREKLKQIKQQAEQNLAIRKSQPSLDINYAARHTKSLNISLIPKCPETGKPTDQQLTSPTTFKTATNNKSNNQKIIAEINLLDSTDDEQSSMDDCEEEDEDVTLPLAAVSCELQCDDDDDEEDNQPSYTNFRISDPHTLQQSKHCESNAVGANNDDQLLVRWEEYEGQRERVFFECFLCGKKVQSSYNLRRHMMIHTGERPFACDICDRRFREFSDLKKHRRRHANERNFTCMVCREHPPIENDPTRCMKCCTQSKTAVILAAMNNRTEVADSNVQSIAETAVRTPPAASKTPTMTSVTYALKHPAKTADHSVMIAEHSTSNSVSSDDPQAQRLLDNIPAVHRPGYNQLGLITRKEFPCPLCNRAFGTRHNLKRHYMIHTGEKPFSCAKCRKPFREYSTLKKHMVTHQRDRWYKCMRCPMKFRDFLKYTEHKESHPQDEEINEDSPSKTFHKFQSSDSYMDSNDEDSISDDWLECCECGQRFNEIDAYNEHLKEHDVNSKIYQCYICKERFEQGSVLEQHLKQHAQQLDSDSNEDVME